MTLRRSEIAGMLYEVSDPELPGISIVDLGMVVDILSENDHWLIHLATTYSGCPAIDVIPGLVKEKLDANGIYNTKIVMGISPPWSYGIAPPNGSASLQLHEGKPKKCPQCGSTYTTLISQYGSTPCKAAYRCDTCKEPFEYFKCF